jgi:D-alanyl-D-alanine dipeptidase
MSDLNATGWHLHFVSSDKTKGGHVLGLNVDEAELGMDITEGFEMALPDNEMFADFDLTIDQSEDIEKVEKNTSGDAEEEKEETNAATTPEEDSSDFVLLSEAVPNAILEIRYYSTYNFVGERIDGYKEPVALLTKEAATALKAVSDDLEEQGYRLKIFDAYRPQMAVDNFVEWAEDVDDTKMKEYFYPELDKSVLFDQGYIAEHSGHSRGSTLDLTLFDMKTEKEVDMGGTFDYFGELSHPDYTDITDEQYENRMILRNAMTKHGFKPLAEEWWHFTLENEPYPDTYFKFPVSSDSVD